MAPNPATIETPAALRRLLAASTVYARAVEQTLRTVTDGIERGHFSEKEYLVGQLLMSLHAVGRDLEWVVERTRPMLGEAEICPGCGSDQRAIIIAHCGHVWHMGK